VVLVQVGDVARAIDFDDSFVGACIDVALEQGVGDAVVFFEQAAARVDIARFVGVDCPFDEPAERIVFKRSRHASLVGRDEHALAVVLVGPDGVAEQLSVSRVGLSGTTDGGVLVEVVGRPVADGRGSGGRPFKCSIADGLRSDLVDVVVPVSPGGCAACVSERTAGEPVCDVKAVCDGVAVSVGLGGPARERVVCESNRIGRRAIQLDAGDPVEGIVCVLDVIAAGVGDLGGLED
jgi:hypothetical protein